MWRPPERIKHPLPAPGWPTAEEAAASLLYRPIRIGPVEAAQRTWVPAMVPWRATEEGMVTGHVIDWYRRFARGRPGVIVVEATGIRDIPSGPLLRIGDDRFVPGLRALVRAVREASDGHTRLFIQCIDFLTIRRRPPAEKYFARFLRLTPAHRARLAAVTGDDGWRDPAQRDEAAVRAALLALRRDDDADGEARLAAVLSARELEDLRQGYRERVTDMHLEHIRRLPAVLPDLFAAAAARAREAGFDGVELHYAHAYTMASFLSARNTRADGYGGPREQRVRLPLEVIDAVRARVGADFAVGARFLGDEVIDGGSRIDDAAYFGQRFAARGVDFLSVSTGGKFEDAAQPKVGAAAYPYTGRSGYECMPTVYSDQVGPFGRNVPLAAAVKRALERQSVCLTERNRTVASSARRDEGAGWVPAPEEVSAEQRRPAPQIRDFATEGNPIGALAAGDAANGAGGTIPVVAAGGIGTFAQAEAILQAGDADIIAAARQTLADPDWFHKMRLGRGHEVRRCEYTNYCEALDQKHRPVTCKLWDRKDLDEPDVTLDPTGRRRLVAPPWRR